MNSKLILLIGAGVLLYLWYENQSSTTAAASTSGLPSDAVPVLGPSGAPLTSSGSYVFYGPSEGQVYTAATAPTSAQLSAGATYWATAAGQAVYKNLMGTASAPSAGTTSSAPTQPVGAGSEVPPAPTLAPRLELGVRDVHHSARWTGSHAYHACRIVDRDSGMGRGG